MFLYGFAYDVAKSAYFLQWLNTISCYCMYYHGKFRPRRTDILKKNKNYRHLILMQMLHPIKLKWVTCTTLTNNVSAHDSLAFEIIFLAKFLFLSKIYF